MWWAENEVLIFDLDFCLGTEWEIDVQISDLSFHFGDGLEIEALV